MPSVAACGLSRYSSQRGASGAASWVGPVAAFDFALCGAVSVRGQAVVGAAFARSCSGWRAGAPLVFVFGSAGEPSGSLEFLEQRVERSLIDAGVLVDFEAVELPVGVGEKVAQQGEGRRAYAEAGESSPDSQRFVVFFARCVGVPVMRINVRSVGELRRQPFTAVAGPAPATAG